MKYILKPSLKHMCQAKIAIQLWTEDDQLAARLKSCLTLNKFSYASSKIDFVKMRNKVEDLQLPTSLQTSLLRFITPIAFHIYHWCEYLNRYYEVKVINPRDLRWTSSGTIDQVKSVQLLLERDHQSLSLNQRYRLACNFCLVEQLQEILQKEMPEEERLVPAVPPAYSNLVPANEQDLVVYFTQYLKPLVNSNFIGDPVVYLSPYQEACHLAILSNNPVATEYFFSRLNAEEKTSLFSLILQSRLFASQALTLPHLHFSSELNCFLLNRMDEKQGEELMKTYPRWIAQHFAVWPYNRYFLRESVDRLWEFFRGFDFQLFFSFIFRHAQKINNNNREDRDCNCEYREMYFELWRSSPVQRRTHFVDHLSIYQLYNYFEDGEVEVCKLWLSEADARQKERLILTERWLYHVRRTSADVLWNFLQFIVEECTSSRETIVRFKTRLVIPNMSYYEPGEIARFVQFLDNFRS